MFRQWSIIAVAALFCGQAAAVPVVEVRTTTPGPFAPGERVALEVYLSQQDGTRDIPIRLLQFDLDAMAPELILDAAFVFDYSGQTLCDFDVNMCGVGYAEFGGLNAPYPTVAIVYLGSQENLSEQIILPQSGAIFVGSIGVRLPPQPGEYSVDVINPETADKSNHGARLQFDFAAPQEWSVGQFSRIGATHFVSSSSDGLFRFGTSAGPADPADPADPGDPPVECARDADCDDGNPCTADDCAGGDCVYSARAAICDDGDPCTMNDICASGECFGEPIAGCCELDSDCNDGDASTADLCVNGTCVHEASEDPADPTPPATADDPSDPTDPVGDPNDPTTGDGGDVPQDDPAGQPTGDGDGSEGSPRVCGVFGLIPGLFMIAGLGFARLRRYSARRFAAPTALRCA